MSARSRVDNRSTTHNRPSRKADTRRTSVRRNERKEAFTPLYAALLICFSFSGMTGLIYQVLWGRMLTLIFGATAAATGAVLAVFMGGLALGGWLAGRRADRLRRPLLVYGLLEAGVGLCALLVPPIFAAAVPLYRTGWNATGGAPGTMFGLRFILACVALLPPTILMGATLPVLSRLCATRPQTLGARLGALYSANILGAAIGAFLAGFVLIPVLGMTATLRTSVLVNFVLCGAALGLQKRFGNTATSGILIEDSPTGIPVREEVEILKTEEVMTLRLVRVVLLGFGLSGTIAMVYEVAWTRALLLIIGSNVQAFAAMLTTFLIGLFVGTLVCAKFADRLRNPLVALAWMEAVVGLAAWFGYLAFDRLPSYSVSLLATQPLDAALGGFVWMIRFGLPSLILLPLSIGLGTLFPIAVRVCKTTLARVGRTVGDLYAGNTVGAIIGALLAGLWLVPHLGTEGTLQAAMTANVALGLALYLFAILTYKKHIEFSTQHLAPVAVFGLLLVAVISTSGWDELVLAMTQTARHSIAVYRQQEHRLPLEYSRSDGVRQQIHNDQKLLFHAEGMASDVAVVHNQRETLLLTNGHVDAGDASDMPTQILLAALPMLLRSTTSAPARVAVVGWGSGVTGGVVEQFPIQQLTALELEPAVLRAADLFRHVNHDSLRDSRLHIVLEDGRNFFLVSDTAFDVIISEPSNIWQAGVCNLFTRDYFRLCRARLLPNGLFAQWIGYKTMPPNELRGILEALRETFPSMLLFRVDDSDAIVVASIGPLRLDAAEVESRIRSVGPVLNADLSRADLSSAAQMVSRIVLGTEELSVFCSGETPNTDDNARLEFSAARDDTLRSYSDEVQAAFAAVRPTDPCKYVEFTGFSTERQAAFRREVAGVTTQQ